MIEIIKEMFNSTGVKAGRLYRKKVLSMPAAKAVNEMNKI